MKNENTVPILGEASSQLLTEFSGQVRLRNNTTHSLSSAQNSPKPRSRSLLLIHPSSKPLCSARQSTEVGPDLNPSATCSRHWFPHLPYREKATGPEKSALKSKCNFLSTHLPPSPSKAMAWLCGEREQAESPCLHLPIQLPFYLYESRTPHRPDEFPHSLLSPLTDPDSSSNISTSNPPPPPR